MTGQTSQNATLDNKWDIKDQYQYQSDLEHHVHLLSAVTKQTC